MNSSIEIGIDDSQSIQSSNEDSETIAEQSKNEPNRDP
jgi:hypothetical protein